MSILDHNDIYANKHYDYVNFRESYVTASSRQVSWIDLARFVLTIMLRIGFLLVQIGSVPVTNINLILLQNIVDFSWITMVYAIGGFAIAYNGDIGGIIGQGRWIGNDESTIDKDEIICGWQATIVASAIFTCCLVGRTHTIGYLLIGLIVSGIVQPFAIHWAWTKTGWMVKNNFLGRNVVFRDYGGSTIVHTIGSLTGYVGCAILGRRILRLRDIDDASVPADSAGTALAGYFFILLGLQSLCFPSTTLNNPRTSDKEISLIVVNNLLGASSCSLVVVALHFLLGTEPFNHWTVMRCVQATIAGTTIISAGANIYNPVFCLGLGCTGGIIHYLVSRRIFQSALEDYCNVIATHLVCSLIGSFFVPFARTIVEIHDDPLTLLVNVAWQIICLVVIVVLVTVPVTIAFGILECLGLLRNRSEIVNHSRAIVAAERGPSRSYMQRLFLPEGETLYLQPCTARVQRHANEDTRNFLNHQRSASNIHKFQEEHTGATRKIVNSQVSARNTSYPSVAVVRSTRVKKLRQVHTLRSTSEIAIYEDVKHEKSMGDDENIDGADNRDSIDLKKKNCEIGRDSMMECSGDSLRELSRINDDSLIEKLTVLCPVEMKSDNAKIENNSSGKNLKRRRDAYTLHRTQKCTNLRLESINENDTSVRFLVRPSSGQSFSSTETDSENEIFDAIIPKKYCRNSKETVTIDSLRKTLECTDIRS